MFEVSCGRHARTQLFAAGRRATSSTTHFNLFVRLWYSVVRDWYASSFESCDLLPDHIVLVSLLAGSCWLGHSRARSKLQILDVHASLFTKKNETPPGWVLRKKPFLLLARCLHVVPAGMFSPVYTCTRRGDAAREPENRAWRSSASTRTCAV